MPRRVGKPQRRREEHIVLRAPVHQGHVRSVGNRDRSKKAERLIIFLPLQNRLLAQIGIIRARHRVRRIRAGLLLRRILPQPHRSPEQIGSILRRSRLHLLRLERPGRERDGKENHGKSRRAETPRKARITHAKEQFCPRRREASSSDSCSWSSSSSSSASLCRNDEDEDDFQAPPRPRPRAKILSATVSGLTSSSAAPLIAAK